MGHGDDRERRNRIESNGPSERNESGLVSCSGPGKSQGSHRPADLGRGKIPFSCVSFTSQCWALFKDRKRDQSRSHVSLIIILPHIFYSLCFYLFVFFLVPVLFPPPPSPFNNIFTKCQTLPYQAIPTIMPKTPPRPTFIPPQRLPQQSSLSPNLPLQTVVIPPLPRPHVVHRFNTDTH
jgi:hypothetical protein